MTNLSHDYAALCAAATELMEHAVLDMLVAPSRRSAAAWGAKRAAEILEASAPTVRFVKQTAATGDVEGSAALNSSTIYVAWKLSLAHTAGIAAHETGHASGIADEDECRSLQHQVAAEWTAHRYKQRDALSLRWKAASERWYATKDATARVEGLCKTMDVQPFLPELACQELELWYDELDMLFKHTPAGPAAHLMIRTSPPPAPRWSFSGAR